MSAATVMHSNGRSPHEVAASNAWAKPWSSAPKNTTPVTATPIAAPTCCIVDRAPDAAPRGRAQRREDRRGQGRDDEAHAGADEQQGRARGGRPSGSPTSATLAASRPRRPPARARRWPAGGARGARQARRRTDATRYATARIVNTSPAWRASSPRPSWRNSASTRKNDAWPAQNTSWLGSPALNARSRNSAGRAAAHRRGGPAGAGGRRTRRAGRARRQRQPRPQRPAVLAALDQRQHDARQPGGDEHAPGDVEAARRPRARLGTRRGASASAASPTGTLMRKQRASQPGDVGLDEHAADQLAAGRRETEHDAVDAQRAHAVLAGVGDADDRQDLRLRARRRSPGRAARRRAPPGTTPEPHAAEASVNSPSPTANIRRRPNGRQGGRR